MYILYLNTVHLVVDEKCMIPARHWDHVSKFCRFPASAIHGFLFFIWLQILFHQVLISSAPDVDYQPVKQNPSHPLRVWFVKRCRLPILRFFPRQRPQKKSRASLHPFVTALSHISASALPEPASEQYSYITLDIGDYHHQFLKISHKKGLAKAFQPCSNEYGMVWVKHF